MANSMCAEPMAGPQSNLAPNSTDDDPLTQDTKSSGSLTHPHLRIVHSAERSPDLSSAYRSCSSSDAACDGSPAMLDRSVQAQIGRLLRDVFADVACEPVPDRFIRLLAELETKETRGE
jgi:hypothetical protein